MTNRYDIFYRLVVIYKTIGSQGQYAMLLECPCPSIIACVDIRINTSAECSKLHITTLNIMHNFVLQIL